MSAIDGSIGYVSLTMLSCLIGKFRQIHRALSLLTACMSQGVQGKCIENKATPTRTTPFSKEKGSALGGTRTHDTLLTRQSALPTELPGQAGL